VAWTILRSASTRINYRLLGEAGMHAHQQDQPIDPCMSELGGQTRKLALATAMSAPPLESDQTADIAGGPSHAGYVPHAGSTAPALKVAKSRRKRGRQNSVTAEIRD
jgi:hypothetical protein